MSEELKTTEHVTIVDDVVASVAHEEIMSLLDAATKKSNYKNWPEFYNEQTIEDLASYLIHMVIVNGKYRLLKSEENHRALRILPNNLWKLGFQVPKDLTKIENIIKTVIKTIKIRFSHSSHYPIYSKVEVKLVFDIIRNPNRPFYIIIRDKINGEVTDIDFDEDIVNNFDNLKAILSAYSHSNVDGSDYIDFDIEDATSQARALLNWDR